MYRQGISLVKGHHYHVTFWAKSDAPQAISIIFYRPFPDREPEIIGAAQEPLYGQVQLAAKSGVNLVTVPMHLTWTHPGETPDFSYLDGVCDYILAANPNALIIPRININAPNWWLDAHPDDEMRWEGPKKNPGRAASVASPVYRKEAEAQLLALIAHLEAAYGDHMAGYHVAGQNSNEWFYEDSHSLALHGYGVADLQSWRQWVAAKYATDAGPAAGVERSRRHAGHGDGPDRGASSRDSVWDLPGIRPRKNSSMTGTTISRRSWRTSSANRPMP